jgi:hypothetical protein
MDVVLAECKTIAEACLILDINPSTVYRHRRTRGLRPAPVHREVEEKVEFRDD